MDSVREVVKKVTRFKVDGAEHTYAFKSGGWDGYKSLGSSLRGGSVYHFATGLVPQLISELCRFFGTERIDDVFDDVCIDYRIPGNRVIPMRELGNRMLLRPYQERMVSAVVRNFKDGSLLRLPDEESQDLDSGVGVPTAYRLAGRGIWKAATGSGKTVACAALIGRLAVRTLFMVYSNDLVMQTWNRFQEQIGPWLSEVGWNLGLVVGGGFNPAEVTVAGTTTLTSIWGRPEQLLEGVHKAVKDLHTVASYLEVGRSAIRELAEQYGRMLRSSRMTMASLQSIAAGISGIKWEVAALPGMEEGKRIVLEEKRGKEVSSSLSKLASFPEKYPEAIERRDKLQDFLEEVDLLVLDEAHGGAADGVYEVLTNCPAPLRLAMSGTPLDRADGANLRIVAAFGDIVANVSNKEMRDVGITPPAKIRMVRVPGKVRMWPGHRYDDLYKKGIAMFDERNDIVVDIIRQAQVEGKQVLVLFRMIDHGADISRRLDMVGIEHERVDGTDDMDRRLAVLNRFRAGVCRVMLASEIFGTGVDIPDGVDVLVNAGGGKAVIGTLQKLGRGLRGHDELSVYDFADTQHRTLAKHALQRLRLYQEQGCFDVQVASVGSLGHNESVEE